MKIKLLTIFVVAGFLVFSALVVHGQADPTKEALQGQTTQTNLTKEQLQDQINQLNATLMALQTQLANQKNVDQVKKIEQFPAAPCIFMRSLKLGDVGDDVKCLQRYLNVAGHPITTSGLGSLGNESTYFGPKTRDAVIKWQAFPYSNLPGHSTVPATGFFGPLSRARYEASLHPSMGDPLPSNQ